MTTDRLVLDFYQRPAPMTSAGEHTALLEPLPSDVSALARIVQGLAIHEFVASPFYGVTIPDRRQSESHIRQLERMLDAILAIDSRPLLESRPAEKRLVGVCHHFAVLLAGMLRAKGIPVRARWGFGSYFNPGFFEDHVLCEYWNSADSRWVRVDAQLDEIWRKKLKVDFDTLDVPPDRFVIAAEAWAQCRAGKADASKFGIFKGDMRGLWFIACSLVKDVAGLNKMEMLPWDVWGAMPAPDERLKDDQIALFDQLADLTRTPDTSFADLRRLYEEDKRVHVLRTVRNALLNRVEAVA